MNRYAHSAADHPTFKRRRLSLEPVLSVLIRFKIHGPALLLSCPPFRHTDYLVVRSHMHKIKSRYAIFDQLFSSRVLASIDNSFTFPISNGLSTSEPRRLPPRRLIAKLATILTSLGQQRSPCPGGSGWRRRRRIAGSAL